jgi:tripartite ATP-independent transporter DctM subunit
MLIILWLVFVIFIITGTPVAFVIGLASIIALIVQQDMPTIILVQTMFGGIDSFVLLAIPFFIMAGVLMNESGITQRLVDLSNSLVGHVRGGLAQVNVLASTFLGGIQGSGNADVATLGTILIPAMTIDGYPRGYSAAVTAASSLLSPIIPPSMMMIVYGAIAQVSIGKLFVGGVFPGLLMSVSMMILCYWYAPSRPRQKQEFKAKILLRTVRAGTLALFMPVIILGGILGGVFTPTEAGVVAAVYAFIVGLVIYRKLTFGRIRKALFEATLLAGMVGILLSAASAFNWILVRHEVPVIVSNWILSLSTNRYVLVLFVILMLTLVGCIMDVMASMIILVPILAPIGPSLGFHEIQWGLMIVMAFALGAITPPIGTNIFLATAIARCPFSESVKAVMPFFIVLFVDLLIIAYVPFLTTYLPDRLLL